MNKPTAITGPHGEMVGVTISPHDHLYTEEYVDWLVKEHEAFHNQLADYLVSAIRGLNGDDLSPEDAARWAEIRADWPSGPFTEEKFRKLLKPPAHLLIPE